MNVFELTALTWLGALLAGFLGALTGLGGGVIVTPLLALVFGIDIHYAMGASLVSVIATSSGAAAAYVKEGFTNMRIGMFLEIATTVGAVVGASIATHLPGSAIAIIFGIVAALLRLRLRTGEEGAGRRWRSGPTGRTLETRFFLPVGHRPAGLPCERGSGRLRPDVPGLDNLSGLLGIGSGSPESDCHGSGHAHPFQGLHHYQ